MRSGMNPERAQTLALRALAFLANSEGALERLLDQSGLDSSTLRDRADDPEFLVSLLDFLLVNEGLLVDFCHDESVDAKSLHMARHILGRQ